MRTHFASALAGLALLACGVAGVATLSNPAGAAPARQPHLAAWGPDIQISSVPTTTVDVNRESSIAVSPVNPNFAFSSWDHQSNTGTQSAYGWSSNGGRTWQGGVFAGPWISDTVPSGDTSIGFDGHGALYYASEIANANAAGFGVISTTNGVDWAPSHAVALAPFSEFRSKGRLAVDPRTSGPNAGSLYMGFQLYRTVPLGFALRYSRDGGQTWSDDIQISDPGSESAEQPTLKTASDGSLYAAYVVEDENFWLDRSTDYGMTWGTDRLITGTPISPTGVLDDKGRELMLVANAQGTLFHVTNAPIIATAPGAPATIYAVWNDSRWESEFVHNGRTGRHGDIAFSRSTDAGATWTDPVRLNDDAMANGIDQFSPAIAVHPNGTIGVSWYDRRDNPNGYFYDVYYSESADGGHTWLPNTRVSDVSSDPAAQIDGKANGNIGALRGMAFGPDYILPTWVDSRGGSNQTIYTDRGTYVAPATPTPPAATATATVTPPSATATPCVVVFSDVLPTDYFYQPVQYLACRGIVSGYADRTFRPYNNTTRAQLSKMVVNGQGWAIAPPLTPTFRDVPTSNPFYGVIETAYTHGVVSGYNCGGTGEPCPGLYFRPNANVTRGQLSKMIVTAKGWGPLTPATPTFTDVPATQPFYGYIEQARAKGIISGYSCGPDPCPGLYFHPDADATRGQLSKILYLALIQP